MKGEDWFFGFSSESFLIFFSYLKSVFSLSLQIYFKKFGKQNSSIFFSNTGSLPNAAVFWAFKFVSVSYQNFFEQVMNIDF